METSFEEQFEGLLETYCELLTAKQDPETLEKVKIWSLYNHMHKTMPHLTAHWAKEHPEGKQAIRAIFEEIKQLNEAVRKG
ncbi:DUF2573 family protein [Marinicrinis lubricantis]|uniref:DUF2573 family protein n=1 Tax=Marinicrinis lubricantis TaxID=2086470 RepID=A0ABW1IUL6_9BACL